MARRSWATARRAARERRRGRASARRLTLRRTAGAAAAFGAIVLLGAQNGGFFADSWGWVALPLLLVVAGAAFAGVDVAPARDELRWLALLGLLAAWTALSGLWAPDAGAPVVEAERTAVYLAAVGAAIVLAARGTLPYAVLAATLLLSGWALADKLVGHSTGRLEGPIGYTNGLGLVAVTGALLATGLARRQKALLATLAVFLPTLVFTYSRGSWVALGAGLVTLGALALRKRRRTLITLAAAGAAAIILGLVAAPHRAAPTGNASRLSSLSGNGRGDYWHVALVEVRAHPLLGGGGGTWSRWWLAHRPNANGALDAHDLYLETLGELGPIGLALLAGALALPLIALRRALRHDWAPACAAAYVALLVHAAFDWDWELPAVALGGLLCGTALLAGEGERRTTGLLRLLTTAVGAVLAAVVLALQVGNTAHRSAETDLDAGRAAAAAADARRAVRWQPWTSEPRLLLGEAQLAAGNVERAARTLAAVTRSDPGNGEAWYELALVTSGTRRRAALARALALDPHGPAAALR